MATAPYLKLVNPGPPPTGPTDVTAIRRGSPHRTIVGRIGALAVALGVGAAIANSPGTALADTGESDASTSSSAGPSARAGAAGSGKSSPTRTERPSARWKTRIGADGAVASPAKWRQNLSKTTPPASSPMSSTPSPRPPSRVKFPLAARALDFVSEAVNKPSRARTNDVEAPSSDLSTQLSWPPGPGKHRTLDIPRAADANELGPATPPTDRPENQTQTVATAVAEAEPADTESATSSPTTPAPSPALWALLAWARRDPALRPDPAPTATPPAVTATQIDTLTAAASAVSVSPLGTPEQLAAEETAARTVKTLPVRAMKLVLRIGWLMTANRQFALVGGPDPENIAQLDEAVDEYAMAAAFQQQLLDSNNPAAVMQVAPPHIWYGQDAGGSRILYDNPDTIYRFMGVNGASSYVISGQFTGEMPAETTFSVLTGLSGQTTAVLNNDDLVVGPDGTFTITASSAPAAPGQTNHLQLPANATVLATRNTLTDWNTQEPMSLSIERTAGPRDSLFSQIGGFAIPGIGPLVAERPLLTKVVSAVPPMRRPPALLRGTVASILMALGLAREAEYIKVATIDPTTGERRQPNVLTDPISNAQFLATQRQSSGYFQLDGDQALVVNIDPASAGYFVVPVYNDWTITDNYWDQQTSLNNAQAVANDDGTYTLVISPTDPGVANWVSTGGLNQGTITIRFQDIDATSPNSPTVSSQVVPLDQLDTVLPPGTVYVTAQERQEQIARRQEGFDNRFAPFPQS